jgi:outer membrane autotransporter protein
MALSLLSEIAADGSNPRLLELTQLNGTQLNTVLSQLSPERLQAIAHSTVFSVQAFNDALFASAGAAGQSGVTAGLIDPMRGGLASVAQDPALLASVVQSGGVAATAPASPFQLFGRGYGIFNKSDSSDNHTGYNADSAGGLFGAQFAFGNELAAGIAVGYNHTHIDFDSSLGTEKDDALRVGPFVTTHLGGFNIESAVTWGYHWTKMETTNFFGAADGDFNAWDITAFGRVGYDFNLEGTLKLTPFAAAQYVYYRQDSFNETGAGGLVHVDANTFDSLRTYLGARLAFTTHMGGMSIIPEVSAAWAHEFLGDNDSISGSFIGGGTPFSVNTTGIDKDSVVAGGGVTALLNDTVSVFVRYDGDFGSNHEIHTVTGGVGIRF